MHDETARYAVLAWLNACARTYGGLGRLWLCSTLRPPRPSCRTYAASGFLLLYNSVDSLTVMLGKDKRGVAVGYSDAFFGLKGKRFGNSAACSTGCFSGP